jgi:hypothetical protein
LQHLHSADRIFNHQSILNKLFRFIHFPESSTQDTAALIEDMTGCESLCCQIFILLIKFSIISGGWDFWADVYRYFYITLVYVSDPTRLDMYLHYCRIMHPLLWE